MNAIQDGEFEEEDDRGRDGSFERAVVEKPVRAVRLPGP